ncbi:ANKRD50 [Symbiodinium sp. CCMP2592]|nr:ANKRD50 [Symbiodinium sp. CCMP2592]
MLRITLLSGEELASLPLTELSDVKALKQRLHQQHGLPPRFRQRLLHDGNPLDDDFQLDTEMDLQAVIAALNATSEKESSELCEAAASGRVAQAEALLQLPMDPDARDEEGCTPLMRASKSGHADIAEMLLEAGAEKDSCDRGGFTALIYAALRGHAQVVQLLLLAGAQKDVGDHRGSTALMQAAYNGRASAVGLLLQAGADVGVRDSQGDTALMDAARGGHAAIVRQLLEAGADKDACNKEGSTALTMQCKPEIQRLLEGWSTAHAPRELTFDELQTQFQRYKDGLISDEYVLQTWGDATLELMQAQLMALMAETG